MNDKPRLIDANALDSALLTEGLASALIGYPRRKKLTVGEIRGILQNAPTITPTPQWIPVTERLPKIYRDKYGELIPFLVCLKDTDYPFRAFFDGKNWGDGWYRNDVIAWMPLPEPFKMDGKDGE